MDLPVELKDALSQLGDEPTIKVVTTGVIQLLMSHGLIEATHAGGVRFTVEGRILFNELRGTWPKRKDRAQPICNRSRYMLRNLSQREQETLDELSKIGPDGNFDHIALSKLFTLNLIKIDVNRRVVLTHAGRALLEQIAEAE
jgi:hypothetical protein